jgi:hypothetical protein
MAAWYQLGSADLSSFVIGRITIRTTSAGGTGSG